MSLEELKGVVESVTDSGVWLSGTYLGRSKWFEGDWLTPANVGQNVSVVVDVFKDRPYLKRVRALGEKIPGFKPPERANQAPFGGGGRRISPEELELKRAERIQIARSVAIDRAITMTERGISIEKIAPVASIVEGYLLSGRFSFEASVPKKETAPGIASQESRRESPAADPSSEKAVPPAAPSVKKPSAQVAAPSARPKRLESQRVNALFNEAKRAHLVADWKDYESFIRGVLAVEVKTAYHLSVEDFAKIESYIRARLAEAKVA